MPRTTRKPAYQSGHCDFCGRREDDMFLTGIAGKLTIKDEKKTGYACKACIRDGNLYRFHGITRQQYDELIQAQGGLCAVCLKPGERGLYRGETILAPDKYHDGSIRGLVCYNCNMAIKLLKNDATMVGKLYRYLSR